MSHGELELPAIRSVGNGVTHFIDPENSSGKLWVVDFNHQAANSATNVGLTRIDHIAQSMGYEEMLTWALFYTTLFQLEKRPVVDVVDPAGIVRSQVIESSDTQVRITLNGADTSRTLAGRFIAERVGSAVQHIAFACDDIYSTAKLLHKNGFDFLPMPANYYEDVQARFGLSDEVKESLQQYNILYDQEANEEFFQIYSKPYGGGFFFEIVQRDSDYQGYGAANAPFRTAALKRLLDT